MSKSVSFVFVLSVLPASVDLFRLGRVPIPSVLRVRSTTTGVYDSEPYAYADCFCWVVMLGSSMAAAYLSSRSIREPFASRLSWEPSSDARGSNSARLFAELPCVKVCDSDLPGRWRLSDFCSV